MNTPLHDAHRLMERLLDWRATPEETRALDALLRASEDARREFLSMAAIDACLPEALRALEKRETEAGLASGTSLRKRANRTRPVWIPLAAAALLLFAVGIGLLLRQARAPEGNAAPRNLVRNEPEPPPPPAPAGRLTGVEGDVTVIAPDHSVRRISGTGTFSADETIRTGPDFGVTLEFNDGTTARMYASTEVTLRTPGPETRVLTLEAGAIDLRVRTVQEEEVFMVATPELRASAKGASFRVMREGTNVWVGAKEGRVDVTRSADGSVTPVTRGLYTAVADYWTFGARAGPYTTCPYWKAQSRKLTGKETYE